ncbi:MAG: hypothetical protein ACQESP_02180 [Candidatus Muiribacteriota bacterium]
MKKRFIYISFILFMSVLIMGFEQNFTDESIKFSETIKNGNILVKINYFGYLNGNVSIRYGINGWQNIKTIELDDNYSVLIILPRNTAQLDFCFKNKKEWDNNNEYNWNIRLKNFLTSSFISDIGEFLDKYDYIVMTQNKIKNYISMLENTNQYSQTDLNKLGVLRNLYDFGNMLNGGVLYAQKSDNEDEKADIIKDFKYYQKMSEGI